MPKKRIRPPRDVLSVFECLNAASGANKSRADKIEKTRAPEDFPRADQLPPES